MSEQNPLTGVVVDAGDGCTHVVPVSDGYVVGSAIKSLPIAGKDITKFVQQLMRVSFLVPFSSFFPCFLLIHFIY